MLPCHAPEYRLHPLPKEAGSPPTRMLIIDDELPICFALDDYFTRQGHHVDCAHALPEASQIITHQRYDVVITDLSLTSKGSLEGLVLSEMIRQKSWTPIVLQTANWSPEVETLARSLGAIQLVCKPTPLSQLAALIDRLVASPQGCEKYPQRAVEYGTCLAQ